MIMILSFSNIKSCN